MGGRNAFTIYINPLDKEWKTKPYARYHDPVAMAYVREFTLKTFPGAGSGAPPACIKNHEVPGFLFSNGGFSGNLYHDYTDVLVPLFISTRQFDGEVHRDRCRNSLALWGQGRGPPFLEHIIG